MNKRKNAQAWYGDFTVALLVFIIGLVVYHTFTLNLSGGDRAFFEEVSLDAQTVSSNLLLSGDPPDWDRYSVVTVGLTDNDQTIQHSKITEFAAMNDSESKKLLGTNFEYFIFFADKDGSTLNVEGVCGIGSGLINKSYPQKAAYYQSIGGTAKLRPFMEDVLEADIYQEGGPQDLATLMLEIENYSLVVFDHPELSLADITSHQASLEQYVSNGGKLMLLGHITIPEPIQMLGVEFQQKVSQNTEDRNTTLINKDEFLYVEKGEQFLFDEANIITNIDIDPINFTQSGEFFQDSAISMARWSYGDNGSVFFVSDTNASNTTRPFTTTIENAARKWFDPVCRQTEIGNLDFKNLIRTERFVIHQGRVLKMVFYLWQ